MQNTILNTNEINELVESMEERIENVLIDAQININTLISEKEFNNAQFKQLNKFQNRIINIGKNVFPRIK